jgi:hypothetical protein
MKLTLKARVLGHLPNEADYENQKMVASINSIDLVDLLPGKPLSVEFVCSQMGSQRCYSSQSYL